MADTGLHTQPDPGAAKVPSVLALISKAKRCADLSRALGAGLAQGMAAEGALTPEQRVGLARAFEVVHAGLAQAAAVVGYAPTKAPRSTVPSASDAPDAPIAHAPTAWIATDNAQETA